MKAGKTVKKLTRGQQMAASVAVAGLGQDLDAGELLMLPADGVQSCSRVECVMS